MYSVSYPRTTKQCPSQPYHAYAVTVAPATVVVMPAIVVVTVTYTVVASGSTGTIVMPAIEVELGEEVEELVVDDVVADFVMLEDDSVTTVGKLGELYAEDLVDDCV